MRSPAAATISGDGVSPAASAAASGSPPGSAAATASADAGAGRDRLEAPQDHALDRRIEILDERRRRRDGAVSLLLAHELGERLRRRRRGGR